MGILVGACGDGRSNTGGGGGGGAIPGADTGVGGAPAIPDAGSDTDVPAPPSGPIYDLSESDHHENPAYQAQVDQFEVLGASLTQPTGQSELFVGHPAAFSAQVRLTAEPLEAPLFYGLRTENAFCVIGDVGVDHLTDSFDAAVCRHLHHGSPRRLRSQRAGRPRGRPAVGPPARHGR